MKKSNFIAMILGTIGTVFFALGMCMALIEDWGMFRQGVICGVIGMVVLLAALGTILVAVVGALLLGVGMCLSMVFELMVPGIVVGLMGIVALLILIPLTRGLKD